MPALLHRLGRAAAGRPRVVLLTWALVGAALFGLSAFAGGKFVDDYRLPGSDSQHAIDLLVAQFPAQAGTSARVVVHGASGATTTPAAQAAIAATLDRTRRLPHVIDVTPPYPSPDGGLAVAQVSYDVKVTDFDTARAVTALTEAAAPARAVGLRTDFGGQVPENIKPQLATSDLVGLAAAALVLLVSFGSVVATGVPILIAVVGLALGTAGISLYAAATTVGSMAPTVATMIGLGVGIDYALFVTSRHRQYLAAGLDIPEAAGRASTTAGRAVLVAGGTVMVSICGLALVGVPNLATFGYATAIVVAVMVLAALTLLPALLGLAGDRLERLRVPRLGRERPGREPASARWARHVGRHPVVYALGCLALLLTVASPLLSMRMAQSDAGSEPTSTTSRRAYDALAAAFGPGANGPLLVVLDLRGARTDPTAAVLAAVGRDADVAAVAPTGVNPAGTAAVLTVIPKSGPQSAATTDLAARLRGGVLTAAVAGTGAVARLAGPTVTYIDVSSRLAQRMPVFMAAVVVLSFLLLLLVFRSLLVPLKAAVMNLLSIGAAYGVMVAVFQWGWGSELLGVHGSVPISPFLPVLMFAALFGLSMDYEVFLLSRIREDYQRSGDSHASVVSGLAGTARVITCAAAIMICVFLSFTLDPEILLKMTGLGLATAVFLDATVVRMALVPATMALLGRANWWLPGWLDRVLPRLPLDTGDIETLPGGSAGPSTRRTKPTSPVSARV
ncbi:MAG: MMPL family transporter [Actinomycetota bacterium]|nr:MMPL family transporter [Actinomycetota bacterium]